MKKFIPLFLVLILFVSCTPQKNISDMLKGKSFLKIYPENIQNDLLKQNKILQILILLHNRVSKEDIIKELNLSEDEYNNIINRLFAEGLVKTNEGKEFVPTCMVITLENESDLKNFISPYSLDLAKIIIEKYSQIKEKYSGLNAFYNISFEEASLFILYNVMFDKWQINNIVESFLRNDIPQRGVNRFYAVVNQIDTAAATNKNPGLENKYFDFGNYKLCAFGRLNGKNNFIDISRTQLINDFKMNQNEDEIAFKKRVIEDLIEFISGNKSKANPDLTLPLNKYGLLHNNQLLLPIITTRDNEILISMANLAKDNIIRYLDSKRPDFVKKYLTTAYKDEVGFREWSFWIYKIMTEEAARILISKGYIKPPSRDLFYYLIEG